MDGPVVAAERALQRHAIAVERYPPMAFVARLLLVAVDGPNPLVQSGLNRIHDGRHLASLRGAARPWLDVDLRRLVRHVVSPPLRDRSDQLVSLRPSERNSLLLLLQRELCNLQRLSLWHSVRA